VSRNLVIMAAVAVIAAGAGYSVSRLLAPSSPTGAVVVAPAAGAAEPVAAASQMLGQRRPDFRLSDADGRPVAADAYDGRVLLVNFWATWCAPCVEEMPMLDEFQRDHAAGVTVTGIAVDDPARARAFARELGVGYPLLFGQPEAMLVGRSYGNHSGMLPYSVLVDASGVVRWTRLGTVDRDQLEAQLAALVKSDG